jgi:L-malate glycosyltransferase
MKLNNALPSKGKQLKKVRVLIVAPSLRILGGQALQAHYLNEQLRQEPSFEVSFVPQNPRLGTPLGVLQSIKYVRTILTSLVYWVALALKIPKHDIIHISSAAYFSFFVAPTPAILIARFFGKKTVLNYHSGKAENHLRRWSRSAIPIMRMANELVVPSQYLVEVFRKFGLRAHKVTNVVDLEVFQFRERRPLLPHFLCSRNLYPLYNVACVLRAFKIIQAKFPNATLKIAGEGHQRSYLEDLTRTLKLRNVDFLGLVAPEKMGKLYNEAHIFLNGSNIDNLPGSILESFASGMPVVSTCAGGIPYLVSHEKTGLLVPKNDPQAMAASAVKLLESQRLARNIARDAREVCQSYTWEAVGKKWMDLYRRLADQTVHVGPHIDTLTEVSLLR